MHSQSRALVLLNFLARMLGSCVEQTAHVAAAIAARTSEQPMRDPDNMKRMRVVMGCIVVCLGVGAQPLGAAAQSDDGYTSENLYEPDPYAPSPVPSGTASADEASTYEPPVESESPPANDAYQAPKKKRVTTYEEPYVPPATDAYGQTYEPPPSYAPPPQDDTFSIEEINHAGHRFFGRVTEGLASVIEHAFQQGGRPNGYILGEEGGGAFVAGLRYGEGTLVTRNAGTHKVFWQGPSIGYDFGAEGSKTMILVYNLTSPGDIFSTVAGVSGSAYVVGGVGITYLTDERVTLAPIRAGLGLRLGANIGYLKFTQAPTWNPF